MKEENIMMTINPNYASEPLVPITRFAPLSEAAESERVELAKTSTNVALLERLARDKSIKVKCALFENEHLPKYIIKYILAEDSSKEVQAIIKEFCTYYLERSDVRNILGLSYVLFSKIPDFTRSEIRRAIQAAIHLLAVRHDIFCGILGEVSESFASPFYEQHEETMDLILICEKCVPFEVRKIIGTDKYFSNSLTKYKVEKLAIWLKGTCPASYSYVRWMTALGETCLKMLMLDIKSSTRASLREEIRRYIKSLNRSVYLDETAIELTVDAIVDDEFFFNKFMSRKH